MNEKHLVLLKFTVGDGRVLFRLKNTVYCF